MTFTPVQIRAFAWAAIALGTVLLLTLLSPVLMPFLVAMVIAYAMHPLVERLARRGWPRWLSAGLGVGLLMLVLLAVSLLIVPVIVQQVPMLSEQIPRLLDRLGGALTALAGRFGFDLQLDLSQLRRWASQLVSGNESELLTGLLSSLRIGGSALAALFGNLFLMPIVAFYLLLDWRSLMGRARNLVPPRLRDSVQGFLDETDEVLGQYLRGQLLVMGIMAVFYAAGLFLLGLDLALPIGVFTGLASFVPFLGFGLGLVLALLAAAVEFQSVTGVLGVLGVYMLGQFVESYFLTPRLVGEAIGLHPIAVIFALLAFGHVFGFVGVLIALPASAVLVVALRRLKRQYLASDLYHNAASGPSDTRLP